jgi:cytoskeleton protein RodZ
MNQKATEQIEETVAAVTADAVGEQLRAAREARGLSRNDVAAELRLHVKLITALEENNRAELPPATFVGGYLRAYARLLDLPAEQLVADYLSEVVVPDLDYRPTDRSGERMVSSRDPKFRLITYGVVGLLLLLFSLWWVNDRYSIVKPVQQSVVKNVDSTQQETTLPLPPSPTAVEGNAEETLPLGQQPAEEGVVAPANTEEKPISALPLPAPQASAAEPAAKPSAGEEASNAAEPEKPKVPELTTEPLPLSTPQATLRLEYQSASWTQVEDAQGRVLVYETINPGRKLELHGVAPFKVFLGYAPGVMVYLNGDLFSHAAYQRGDLARFRVGSSQDNRPLDR